MFTVVDPGSPHARAAMGRYFAELDDRFAQGFDAAAALEVSLTAYAPPQGLFVVAGDFACGALTFLDEQRAEVKRMWVAPERRGEGIASRLLAFLEAQARTSGRTTVVLDTNASLVEAIALYRRSGYVEVPAYNSNPNAHHWFAKNL